MLSVIDGYNVCIFAYGQTGSGKTFTMIGASDLSSSVLPNNECQELAGITPRAVSELFRLVNERHAQCSSVVTIQMFQLYRDGLEDLLQGTNQKRGRAVAAVAPVSAGDATKRPSGQLKITLAEHSPTGLVHVSDRSSPFLSFIPPSPHLTLSLLL
jgi:hypothetical protein